MKPVRFAAPARDEFLAGTLEYGARFRNAVTHAIARIRRFPAAWGAIPGQPSIRRFVLKRFPFVVVYRETSTDIRVLAIAPTKRDPAYWQHRG